MQGYYSIPSVMRRECKQQDIDLLAKVALRDRYIITHVNPSDFLVYGKDRTLRGVVCKHDDCVMYAHTTSVGLSVFCTLIGYTKRMPKRSLQMLFGEDAYMIDARQVLRKIRQEESAEIGKAGPHDRRPQTPNQPGRKPTHKSDFVAASHMWYRK